MQTSIPVITPRWNACDNSSNVAISPYRVHFWEIKIHVCKHKRHIERILNYKVKLHFDKKMMQPWTCRKFVFWQQIDFIPKKKHTPVQKIIYSTSLMQEGVFSLVYARVLMFLKTTSSRDYKTIITIEWCTAMCSLISQWDIQT